jgi:hypothetical protein
MSKAIICDRCDEVVEPKAAVCVEGHWTTPPRKWDLCKGCIEALTKFLKGACLEDQDDGHS